MSEDVPGESEDAPPQSEDATLEGEKPSLHVEAVGDFLRCPTRYRFEHETPLSGEEDETDDRRVELLRTVVCDALRRAIRDDAPLTETADAAFDDEWPTYADGASHHSRHQHEYDRLVLSNGVEDTCERHVDPEEVAAARAELRRPVVGPGLDLDVDLGGRQYRVTVDYLRVADGRLDAVCLTDSLRRVGLPYPNVDVFEKHFEEGQFRPKAVTRLFETYLTEQWLADAVSDASCEPGSLYYAGAVENHNRAGEAVRVESEWRAVGTHYDCSDSDLLGRLRTLRSHVDAEEFDPATFFDAEGFDAHSFEDVVEYECDDCAYRVGCEQRIRTEVRFDE